MNSQDRELGTTTITFSGGESLLFRGLRDLVEFAASRTAAHVETVDNALVVRSGPPNLFLLTNGREMGDELLEVCREHDVHLSLSLPGLSTYRSLTGSDTDPRRVLGWLRRAHEIGLRTTANVTVTRPSLFELAQTIGEALLAGADFLLLNRFLPGGRGLESASEFALRPGDIAQMLHTAEAVLAVANRQGSVGTEIPLCLSGGVDLKFLKISSRCAAGSDFFVIGPSGRARVCNHSPVQLAHYTALESLSQDPYWRRYALRELLPTACGKCELQFRCDGGCHEAAAIVSGSLWANDPAVAKARMARHA